MWRDISSTQVHQSLNPYQQYPPPPSTALNGGSKWNVAGQRSSYSLPHPGHEQSNMRWQKPADIGSNGAVTHQLSSSTRNLTHNTSFLHPSGAGGGDHQPQRQGSGLLGQRQRPASMYDTPSSMGYHHQNGGGMAANKVGPPPPARNGGGGTLRQNAGELVSECNHNVNEN